MPDGESLAAFAATGATLCIHLSINNLVPIVRDLTPILGADMPVAVVYRVSWPDQQIIRGTLASIRAQVKQARITRTAISPRLAMRTFEIVTGIFLLAGCTDSYRQG